MGPLRKRLTFMPFMLAVSAGLAVVATLIAYLVAGGVAALGALAGVGVVVASYGLSSLLIAWADSVNPKLVLPVGLFTYGVKFTALFILLSTIAASGWAGLRPMAFAIGAGALVWSVGHAWWLWHAKILYVDPDG